MISIVLHGIEFKSDFLVVVIVAKQICLQLDALPHLLTILRSGDSSRLEDGLPLLFAHVFLNNEEHVFVADAHESLQIKQQRAATSLLLLFR